MDVRSRRGADIDSDHNLEVATLRLRPTAINSSIKRNEKYNTARLKDPAVVKAYNQSLHSRLNANPQNSWQDIKQRKHEIQTRKKLHNAIFRSKCPATKTQARIAYRQSARNVTYIHSDRERYLNEIANEAEQASNTGNLRSVYAAIKQLCGNNIRDTAILKDNDGSDLSTTDEQLVRWCDYFTSQSQTTNRVAAETDILLTRRNPRRAISTDPPPATEIISILDNMKHCKSAGPDTITAELLKYGSNIIAEYLTPLIQNAWINNSIPNDWKEGTVIYPQKRLSNTMQKLERYNIAELHWQNYGYSNSTKNPTYD
ncbi:uncharacterized protein [Musca autumnalis]|uniref:uncharacterized protein n=1 Tax=Musca autumnalis TaxID=221902 RepID=UPI003CFA46C1